MQRNFGQKIAFFFSILCYLAGAGFLIASVVYESAREGDPIHASLMASVIFFVGCAIVLHVIARTRLKGLIDLKNHENSSD